MFDQLPICACETRHARDTVLLYGIIWKSLLSDKGVLFFLLTPILLAGPAKHNLTGGRLINTIR